jgi:ferredoxin
MATTSAPAHEKMYPMSEGTTTSRKKKPKILAQINENCTGCSGAPVCVGYCPVAECMYWVPDEDHPPFGRIEVDPQLCIGCKLCTAKGPDSTFLDGCPWDAIDMIPTEEVEKKLGITLTF